MSSYIKFLCCLTLLCFTKVGSFMPALGQTIENGQLVTYSGLWNDISKEIPANAAISKTMNCEVMFRDSSIKLRGLSVGICSIVINLDNKKEIFDGRLFSCQTLQFL